MRLLYGQDQIVSRFVARQIPHMQRGFGPNTAIGVLDDENNLIAGAVFHNWEPESGVIEISGASITKRWLTRDVLRAVFSYTFDQLECQMVVARHPVSSESIRRQWKMLGASEYIIPRLGGRDRDIAIATLTEETWRSSKFARSDDG